MQPYTDPTPALPLAAGKLDLATGEREQPITLQQLQRADIVLTRKREFRQATAAERERLVEVFEELTEYFERGWLINLGRDALAPQIGLIIGDEAPIELEEREWINIRSLPGGDPANVNARLLQQGATMLALATWHNQSVFCGRCGKKTRVSSGGWVRSCECGLDQYPRTDPVVITMILDQQGRLLLARNAAWDNNRVSLIAGYMEAGESVQDAVRREVREEVGLEVDGIQILDSQAWPYPRSLMLGCVAFAKDTHPVLADGEISAAFWVSLSDIDQRLAAGEFSLPSLASIARQLIERWRTGSRLSTGAT